MTEILMPRLSDTMEEGVISSWQKKPGDEVAVGDVIVDIETDKAVMEYEAYEAGVLEEILVPEGESAAIGAPIARIAPTGGAKQTAPTEPATEPEPEPEPAPQAEAEAEPEPAPAPETPARAPERSAASRPT
ncbi:biotin/lipoyl-containing protein, partial [Actinomadura sp. BRA 177]|uniref:biotin/lipoyl-containing protein n=1 Tax=Actinomadura sp. BRA 177 TaxID=2745202 RepID=UPI001853A455